MDFLRQEPYNGCIFRYRLNILKGCGEKTKRIDFPGRTDEAAILLKIRFLESQKERDFS